MSATVKDDRPGQNGLDKSAILSLGLGWFFSAPGLFAVIVSVMLVTNAVQRLDYAVKSEPLPLTADNMPQVARGEFVTLAAQLDRARGISVRESSGTHWTIDPVAGTNGRLFVYRKGCGIDDDFSDRSQVYAGRIVGRDWADQWELDGMHVSLAERFAVRNITVPKDALVLVAGDVPRLDPWQAVAGGLGLVLLLWFALRAARTVHFFRRPDQLQRYVRGVDPVRWDVSVERYRVNA